MLLPIVNALNFAETDVVIYNVWMWSATCTLLKLFLTIYLYLLLN